MLLPVRLRGRDFGRSRLRCSELQTAEDVDLLAGRDSQLAASPVHAPGLEGWEQIREQTVRFLVPAGDLDGGPPAARRRPPGEPTNGQRPREILGVGLALDVNAHLLGHQPELHCDTTDPRAGAGCRSESWGKAPMLRDLLCCFAGHDSALRPAALPCEARIRLLAPFAHR
jgi:hypothetical protein